MLPGRRWASQRVGYMAQGARDCIGVGYVKGYRVATTDSNSPRYLVTNPEIPSHSSEILGDLGGYARFKLFLNQANYQINSKFWLRLVRDRSFSRHLLCGVACLLLRRLRHQGGCPLFQCRNQGFQLCHLVLQHGNFFLQVR